MAQVTLQSLGRNSLYGFAGQVWRIGSRFVLTPLIIGQIGLEGYGVWTLLFTLCAYADLFETNVGFAYSKLTAEHDVKGEYRQLGGILSSGMAFMAFVGLLGLATLWRVGGALLESLGVPEALLHEAQQALLLVGACVVLKMSAGCAYQVLSGLQRMDLRYKLQILSSALEFSVTLVCLLRGWGLRGLAVGYLCGQVMGVAVAWVLVRRICPTLRISPLSIRVRALKGILSLGARYQLLSMLQLGVHQGVKLAVSGFLGVSLLAVYEIGWKLLSLGSAVGGALISPLMPAFANLHAAENRDRAQALYWRACRLVALTSVSCFGFLAVFADPLIVVWTSAEYPLAAWTVRCMALAFIPGLVSAVGTASLRARGRVRMESYYWVIIAGSFAALIYPGYRLWGYQGIIAALVAGSIAGSAWFLVSFARREAPERVHFLRDTLIHPIVHLTPIIVLVAVCGRLAPLELSTVSLRWSALANVAVWGIVFGAAVAIWSWFAILSVSERVALASLFPQRASAGLRRILRFPGE